MVPNDVSKQDVRYGSIVDNHSDRVDDNDSDDDDDNSDDVMAIAMLMAAVVLMAVIHVVVILFFQQVQTLYSRLMLTGQEYGIRNMGWYALNNMRVEKGSPMIGNELAPLVTPYDVGLDSSIDFNKVCHSLSPAIFSLYIFLIQIFSLSVSDIYRKECITRSKEEVPKKNACAYGG